MEIKEFKAVDRRSRQELLSLKNIKINSGSIVAVKTDDFVKAKVFLYSLAGYSGLFPHLDIVTDISSSKSITTQLFTEIPHTQLSGLRVSVGGEIALPAECRCMDTLYERVTREGETFGLREMLGRSPFSLSTGELQKTVLASQHITEPSLWILFYPASGLDFKSQEKLKEILEKEGKDKIIIIYDLPYLMNSICNTVLDLERGTLSLSPTGDNSLRFSVNPINDGFSVIKFETHENNRVILETRGLYFSYTEGKPLIRDFCFSLKEKEKVAIVGPNGSGKSTFAKLICGILKPQRGEIKVSAVPFFVPSNPSNFFLFPTVKEEILAVNASLKGSDIGSLLDRVGLHGKEEEDPSLLPIEEKKLLSLLLASISDSSLVILDEPTAFSSSRCQKIVVEMIENEFKDKALMLITHDIELLKKVLRDGKGEREGD